MVFDCRKINSLLFIFLVLLISSYCFSLEIKPYKIKTMDATIIQKASGSLEGEISSNDEMKVTFLTFKERENQSIIGQGAKITINGLGIDGKFEDVNGNRYAVFELKDLSRYAETPSFSIEIKTRLVKGAELEVGSDYNLSLGINEFSEFKQPTAYIESNDPELISKAGIEFTSDSAIESLREIAEWVKSNVVYDYENYYRGTYSAKHTYEARAGVCDEFANLTAAFLRIRGIPAKYVSGISFDGKTFGNHGWLKAYLPGRWYAVDSTFGEVAFLDAGHFELSEAEDANELKDIRIITKSIHSISAETVLLEPEVEINSFEKFSSLAEIEANAPEKAYSGGEFEITAKIRNISGSGMMIPVELAMHDDFEVEGKERIVLIEKDSGKDLRWNVKNSSDVAEDRYFSYDSYLDLPDQNKEFKINVYKGDPILENKAEIGIRNIFPKINYEAGVLEITIEAFNNGGKEGAINWEIYYGDEKINSYFNRVAANSSLIFSQKIGNFRVGTYSLFLKSGDFEKEYSVIVPEKPEEKIVVREKPRTTNEGNNISTGNQQPILGGNFLLYAAAGIAAGMAIVVVLVFALKIFSKDS